MMFRFSPKSKLHFAIYTYYDDINDACASRFPIIIIMIILLAVEIIAGKMCGDITPHHTTGFPIDHDLITLML